jgi:hypothetical protein
MIKDISPASDPLLSAGGIDTSSLTINDRWFAGKPALPTSRD